MRTTVVVYHLPGRTDYWVDYKGRTGGGGKNPAGVTAFEAATTAARLMMSYGQGNPEGGDLMAPPEVLEHVPSHLRNIAAR
jgi:hypothetical protein